MKKALKFEMESSFKRQIQNLGHLDIGTEMTKIQNMSKLVQKKKEKKTQSFFFFKKKFLQLISQIQLVSKYKTKIKIKNKK